MAVDETKVLLVYTGGTIGMMLGPTGYRPEPYFLTESLRSQAWFHDPLEHSIFSHAGSSAGFREWSTQANGTQSAPTPPAKTLLVRSSRPIGAPAGQPGEFAQVPTCRQVSEDVYEADLPPLVTPKSSVHGMPSKRIRYAVLEWNPLLDSSNIESEDWIRIATEIELNYSTFDAFVVLHGTDTMAYTSSALSFLLEDLGKTVVITGAQIPLSQLRNDAVDNLLGALVIAGHYVIPESCLYFNHTLFRGNRVVKQSSYDFNAFDSPNFPPLVDVGIDITVNWDDVIRQTSLKPFRAHKELCHDVVALRLFPGIPASAVRAFLAPPTKGVVLETFGAGNAPQRAELLDALSEACARGVVVVAITQCSKGAVSDAYETGRALLDRGVVAGGDMTPECALAKLRYLLAKPGLSRERVRELVSAPIRGELTRRDAALAAGPATLEQSVGAIQSLLGQLVRLASGGTAAPTSTSTDGGDDVASEYSRDEGAPWTHTAAEAAAAEAALYPFLVHAAAARDDVAGVTLCVQAAAVSAPGGRAVPGGIVNCVDAASGRSPLHTAALNGSVRCTEMLLQAGALVHVRDLMGHTALYYAARQRHEGIVDLLRATGANLSGSDIDGGFVALAAKKADALGQRIWQKCGAPSEAS